MSKETGGNAMSIINVYLRSKKYNAFGEYEDGKIIVKKGSKINTSFNENYALSPKAKKYRDSSEYVGTDYIVKKDISFSSPSTAAQFVLGYSSNG